MKNAVKSDAPISSINVVGTRVFNHKGEECGAIADVVFRRAYGEISYLILSYPGHFGVSYADKRFAVPYESFDSIEQRPEAFFLNVDEAFLKKAPGFSKHELPDFADPRFITEHAQYYQGITLDIAA